MKDTIAPALRRATRPLAPLHAVKRWFRLRRCRAQLSRLSDHMLRDIGLSRCEIDHAILRGRFPRG
ncbi:DUF1127 domain-containing protein [Aestuariivirga sp.]|uniref:DUF1127 domain-containing protein n=1 Tax=Aestuariivirga sp. TaxID=2650926 RepID=UPI00391CD101